jgi:hypothetical protein
VEGEKEGISTWNRKKQWQREGMETKQRTETPEIVNPGLRMEQIFCLTTEEVFTEHQLWERSHLLLSFGHSTVARSCFESLLRLKV